MKVKIVSPAKAIDPDLIDKAADLLMSSGYEVTIGENAKGNYNYFSGTDEQRHADLQAALDDPEVDAILCSRGGYGLVRIVDYLDYTKFQDNPKLICGYSDVTVLHNHIHTNFNLPTLHCAAPLNFPEATAESLKSLLNVLDGKGNLYEIGPHEFNRNGKSEGVVVGGNLSIIASLIGTNSDIDTAGKILLIEDIGEAIYAVDRMLWSMKKSGKLHKLAGLIVGGFTGMKDSAVPFGSTVEEVIREAVSDFDFPVCFDFPSGHIDDNRAVIFGYTATLHVKDEGVVFSQ